MAKLKIKDLEANKGQIEGVPKNPRNINEREFEKLKESLIDDPQFTELHPILVIEHPKKKEKYIVLGGNMRTKAVKELGWENIEASIMPKDTPPEVIRARIIKHNKDYGHNDDELLQSEWDFAELKEWGIELLEESDPIELNRSETEDYIATFTLFCTEPQKEKFTEAAKELNLVEILEKGINDASD